MIPRPPGIGAIIDGISFGLGLAMRRTEPEALKRASVWDALWFRYMLVFAEGMLVIGFGAPAIIALFGVVTAVYVLAYPVITQVLLEMTGLAARWRVFIIAVTWVFNLWDLIVIPIVLVHSMTGGGTGILILLVAVGLWMLWATWSAAARSLGNRGLAGAGMVALMLVLQVFYLVAFVSLIQPIQPS